MQQARPDAYSRGTWEAVRKSMDGSEAGTHPVMATLYAEHRYMATLMKLLADQLDALERGEKVDSHVLYESLHYMTHFPDAFHHPREDLVYQRAGELDRGLADSVDTLQRDHDHVAKMGAETLRAVERWQAGELEAAEAIKPARDYIDTVYRHMSVEEQAVFPKIEEILTEEDWRELEREDLIDPVADPIFGPRVGREYRNIARKARRALRRGVEDATLVEWIGLEAVLEGLELASMAFDNGREAAREHFDAAVAEAGELFESRSGSGGPWLLPWRFAAGNARHYVGFLRDLGDISRDTLEDLSQLGRDTRERIGLIRSEPPSRAKH